LLALRAGDPSDLRPEALVLRRRRRAAELAPRKSELDASWIRVVEGIEITQKPAD
jgi:hypothetical protein